MTNKDISCSAIAALCFTLVTACDKEATDSVVEPAVRPAKLLTIQNSSNQRSLRYPAVIGAAQSSDLTFQVGGLLQELRVNETQQVKQNEIIAKLDQRDFKSKLDSAKAQFDNAETEYQRAVRLVKEDAIAKSVLEQRKSQRDIAKAQFDTANKALNDTVLRAPFDGVIAKVSVKKLETIQPGQKIASLISAGTLEATINLPANVIVTASSRTDKGAFVVLEAAPENRIPAKYKEAVLEADAVSQTYAVTFAFEPPKDLIVLPGMNATVVLTSSSKESALSNAVGVPLDAIMSEGGQQYLWIVDSDTMQVSKRNIEIQEGIGETLMVTEGLTAGETIVAAGAAYLAEGMKVRPWADD